MSDNDIVKIIEELRQLRILELQVLTDLEARIIRNLQTQADNPTTPDRAVVDAAPFRIGDRVYITNRLHRIPRNRTANQGDRISIVTKVFAKRIELRTINGDNKWRIPGNIRLARNDE
jgi:hypothetical protein